MRIIITTNYHSIITVLFISYSAYEVIASRYGFNRNVGIALAIIYLCSLLIAAIKKELFLGGKKETSKPSLLRLIRLWYILHLGTLALIFYANPVVSIFLLIQIIALATNRFPGDVRNTYVAQILSLFFSGIYVTIIILQTEIPTGGLIILSFFASWVALQVAMHNRGKVIK